MEKPDSPSSSPRPLRLYLLGHFQLQRSGQPIALYSRKVESLLAYLVLHPQAHPREKLAALFWGGVAPQQASASLRVGLNNLRQHLGAGALLTDRATVQLNPAWPLWVDARVFLEIENWQAGAGLPALQQSLGLYDGDLLPDFYDAWLTPKREELRDLYLSGLQLGAAHARAHQHYPQAIAFARQILLAEPTEETAHRHLMFCYAALGDRNAALQQFETCRRLLHDELAVAPSSETLALYERLVQQADAHSLAGQLSNLPRPDTSFIGRQPQRQDLQTLLGRARLVTLIGAGGSGKTRLAIQVAADLLNSFQEGVWWIDLSALQNESLLPQTLARALGVKEQPQTDLTEALCDALGQSQRLLIIDNCEHLLSGVGALVQRLLTHSSQLRVMATSRQALNVPGEHLYTVPPLALPQTSVSNLHALLGHEAIALFLDRAAAHYPTLSPNRAELNDICQICLRLDGIPLALELAAAQMGAHTPAEILTRLTERLDLARPRSSLPVRHRTLRAALDWGYDLLTAPEKILFQRLAVFAGGCTLEQAVAVAGGSEPLSQSSAPPDGQSLAAIPVNSQWLVQTMLTNLVNKSLVQLRPTEPGQRYVLLETIRDYARERLQDSREAEALQSRHYDFFASLADEAEAGVQSAEAERWMTRLTLDYDNLRAALGWAVARDRLADGESGLSPRLAGALWPFWHYRGYVLEAQSWLSAALAACPLKPDAALELQRNHARVLSGLGTMAWMRGDSEDAEKCHRQALALYRAIGDVRGIVMTLNNTATAYIDNGQYAEGSDLLVEGLALARTLGSPRPMVLLLVSLGSAAEYLDRYDQAGQYFAEALNISRENGWELETCLAQNNLGDVALWQADLSGALAHYLGSLQLARQLNNTVMITSGLIFSGMTLCLLGQIQQAEMHCREAIALATQMGYRSQSAESLVVLGLLMEKQGHLQIATQVLSAATAHCAAIGYPMLPVMHMPYDEALDRLRTRLPGPEFEALWAVGQTLTVEAVSAL